MQFIDLKKQYEFIKDSVQKRMAAVIDQTHFILGPEIPILERKLAEYTGTSYCVTCASGTDALLLSLLAKDIGPGDAVFTTTFTFIATAEVISLVGATPVFVDIDRKTYNIDAYKLRDEVLKVKEGSSITASFPKNLVPKAVIPVDLFGLCADYDAIDAVAKEFGLFVLEDAAQSFGAIYKGKKACSFGECAATSFFPAKPLGCYGDGGAIFMNSRAMFDIIRSLRVHGQGADKYENVRIGINGRLDTLQAAVLLAKLEIFENEMQWRQSIAAKYSAQLKIKFVVPTVPEGYRSTWAQYSILNDSRKEVITRLKYKGVPTAIYYPKPLHLQNAFAFLGYEKGQFPVAEEVVDKIFSIPMHPYLEEREQDMIIDVLLKD
ncbi:MAG: DegT/DnrJ/EryC1/StrS family aminotransferase [Candidatus Latescibacteria bacterium]|nr:DegT/DnrJ/EryC1/StrS family aminotransferase [Candidatus Latescibacterota bacterium]